MLIRENAPPRSPSTPAGTDQSKWSGINSTDPITPENESPNKVIKLFGISELEIQNKLSFSMSRADW